MAGIDLTDLGNFADGFPHHLFRVHRQVSPVYWHEPTPHTPDGEGFWSVATHAEVLEVLRDPATYSSQGGGHREHGGTLIQDLPAAGQVLNMMDDPRHAQIRRIVSAGLTPRMIRRVEDDIRQRVRGLLDEVRDGITFDFLRTVAAELPMQICVLLGVPEEDRHWLFDAVEPGFDVRDGRMAFESSGDRSNPASARMFEYGTRLIEQKRRHPDDDMLSAVVNARIEDGSGGEGGRGALSDSELYMFFSLLFSAGSETTRNAIAGGLVELAARPQQLARLHAESTLIPTAIEEFVRWTSPSPSKRRTATRGCELGGRKIAPGDKVVIWEGSANRDELVRAGRVDPEQPSHRYPAPDVVPDPSGELIAEVSSWEP